MAGVLTADRADAPVREAAGALIGLRRTLARNAPGGSATVRGLRVVGLGLAAGTILCGLVRFEDPGQMVDLVATLLLGWLLGWVMGPVVVRGAGLGLRPEWFALLPIPMRRLAAGLLAASLVGFPAAVTLVAFAVLPVAAAQFGLESVLVAVPAMLLELVLVVVLSRVVTAALTASLSARRGQELGGLLMAVVIALTSGGWSLATVMGQQLSSGPPTTLRTVLRLLPSGWGPVAVAAADRSDWPVVLATLGGLAVGSGLLLLGWAGLLPWTMRRPGGRTPRTARRRPARPASAGEAPPGWGRLLPATPTGAVVVRELHTWRRDPGRLLTVLLALLIAGLNLAVPAIAFHLPAALPWAGLAAALIIGMGAANLYGEDGTALWLTRMVPGSERADVRGRQLAWLLVVAPLTVILTVALTVASGRGWAWPWVLATLPAILGGTAGLMVLLSVTTPVRQKDPHRRSGPFDTGDDPNAAGALIGTQYLMLGLAAACAVPAGVLVLLGTLNHQPVLQVAGILVGVATGVLGYWWGGRVAARRLDDRGAELMDLFNLGPQDRPQGAGARAARAPAATGPRRRDAAVGTLVTVGIICLVPQGLVPVAFNLFGVDPEVKVWFAARYAPQNLQLLVAAGFIVAGALALWWAGTIRRHQAGRPSSGLAPGPK